jgi:hypothetical protein
LDGYHEAGRVGGYEVEVGVRGELGC